MTKVVLDRSIDTLRIVNEHNTVYIHDVIGLQKIETSMNGENFYVIVKKNEKRLFTDRIFCRPIDIKEDW